MDDSCSYLKATDSRAATTGGISEYENVPSDEVMPVISDHAMLLIPVDHEPATGAHG
jgi:hypothetical protein